MSSGGCFIRIVILVTARRRLVAATESDRCSGPWSSVEASRQEMPTRLTCHNLQLFIRVVRFGPLEPENSRRGYGVSLISACHSRHGKR